MQSTWNDYFAKRVDRLNGSQIRSFFSLTESSDVISFAGGFPDSRAFPKTAVTEALTAMIQEESKASLQYAPTEGNYQLRSYLASKMCQEGVTCEAEDVVVTDGTQQALDLLFKVMVNPGDPVLVEEPTYIGGVGAITSYGGEPIGIPMDSHGMKPEDLESIIKELHSRNQKPKVLYTIPNFHNPTGFTLCRYRREKIYQLASKYHIIIIEDNPYGEISFDEAVPSSFKSMDVEGRVAYLGSFSKTFLPGIRVGWIVAPTPLLEKVGLAKQTADLCSASLGQRLAYRLSVEGYVDKHVKELIAFYREKRDTMLDYMNIHFPTGVGFTRPQGGFFVWVSFPPYYPASSDLLSQSLERKVAFVHGEGFFSNGKGSHTARFSYSQNSLEEIKSGIKTLGELFSEIEHRHAKDRATIR